MVVSSFGVVGGIFRLVGKRSNPHRSHLLWSRLTFDKIESLEARRNSFFDSKKVKEQRQTPPRRMAEHDDEAMDAARDDDAESSIMAVEKVSAAEVDGAFVGNEENRQNASSAADTAAALPKKNDGPNNNNKEEEPLVAPVAAAAGQSANHNPLKRPVASILNEAGKIDVAADNTNPAASSIPNDADDNVTAKQQQPSPPPPLAPEEPPLPVVVAAAIDITKPVKRARTAYLIFADDKRGEVQEKVRQQQKTRRRSVGSFLFAGGWSNIICDKM